MNIISSVFLILAISVFTVNAVAQSECSLNAHDWIRSLQSPKKSVLRNHCDNRCTFVAKWVKQIDNIADKNKRENTCYHLVLIWSQKDCVYFRDVIDPAAYYPCKGWTQEMFRQCMADNTEWFQERATDK